MHYDRKYYALFFVFVTSLYSAEQDSANTKQYSLNNSSAQHKESLASSEQTQDDAQQWPFMTGSLGGLRNRFQQKGLSLEGSYIGDFVRTSNEVSLVHNVGMKITIDMERHIGWQGATLVLYGLGNGGGTPGKNTDVAQGISSIEAFPNWRLYVATLEQNIHDNVSLLFGLYDLNTEFYSLQKAGLFINPSFGIGSDMSQTGKNGPSIFPTTSLALRIKYNPIENFYMQGAVLDGVPGSLQYPTGTHIVLSKEEGMLCVGEFGYAQNIENASYTKTAVGVWAYTSSFDDVLNNDNDGDEVSQTNNAGMYFLGEHTFSHFNAEEPSLSIFGRIGFANSNINRFDYTYCGGVTVSNAFVADDNLGVAFTNAHNGWKYMKYALQAGESVTLSELIFEGTYAVRVAEWCTLQPNVQYIVSPNTREDADNLVVSSIRIQIGF